jgi:hypothetical protein
MCRISLSLGCQADGLQLRRLPPTWPIYLPDFATKPASTAVSSRSYFRAPNTSFAREEHRDPPSSPRSTSPTAHKVASFPCGRVPIRIEPPSKQAKHAPRDDEEEGHPPLGWPAPSSSRDCREFPPCFHQGLCYGAWFSNITRCPGMGDDFALTHGRAAAQLRMVHRGWNEWLERWERWPG